MGYTIRFSKHANHIDGLDAANKDGTYRGRKTNYDALSPCSAVTTMGGMLGTSHVFEAAEETMTYLEGSVRKPCTKCLKALKRAVAAETDAVIVNDGVAAGDAGVGKAVDAVASIKTAPRAESGDPFATPDGETRAEDQRSHVLTPDQVLAITKEWISGELSEWLSSFREAPVTAQAEDEPDAETDGPSEWLSSSGVDDVVRTSDDLGDLRDSEVWLLARLTVVRDRISELTGIKPGYDQEGRPIVTVDSVRYVVGSVTPATAWVPGMPAGGAGAAYAMYWPEGCTPDGRDTRIASPNASSGSTDLAVWQAQRFLQPQPTAYAGVRWCRIGSRWAVLRCGTARAYATMERGDSTRYHWFLFGLGGIRLDVESAPTLDLAAELWARYLGVTALVEVTESVTGD